METFAISSQGSHSEAMIGECLDRLQGRLSRIDFGKWSFVPRDADGTSLSIRMDPDWLVIEQALSDGDISCIESSMPRVRALLNPPFPMLSGARAMLSDMGLEVRVRADLPIPHKHEDAAGQLPQWVGRACAELAFLADGEAAAVAHPEAGEAEESAVSLRQEIRDLCDQAGWSAVVRDTSGQVAITLPNREGGHCIALATPHRDGVSIQVELGVIAGKGTSAACRAAAAVLLLRTAGIVRLVRARADSDRQETRAFLEVCLQSPVEVGLVDQALSALACAHQQVGFELEALARDHALANAYLALQGCGERGQ